MNYEQARQRAVFADAEEAYQLLLHAVNLAAVTHNMLVSVPDLEGSPSRFWRKMHEVRRVINDPRTERVRLAYVRSLAAKGMEVGSHAGGPSPRNDVGEDFRHVCDHPGLDCGGRPVGDKRVSV